MNPIYNQGMIDPVTGFSITFGFLSGIYLGFRLVLSIRHEQIVRDEKCLNTE